MIVGIGSIALDTTTTPFNTVQEVLGGAAVNFALSASFFKEKTGIVGVIGTDFPKDYYDILNERIIMFYKKKNTIVTLLNLPIYQNQVYVDTLNNL